MLMKSSVRSANIKGNVGYYLNKSQVICIFLQVGHQWSEELTMEKGLIKLLLEWLNKYS